MWRYLQSLFEVKELDVNSSIDIKHLSSPTIQFFPTNNKDIQLYMQ